MFLLHYLYLKNEQKIKELLPKNYYWWKLLKELKVSIKKIPVVIWIPNMAFNGRLVPLRHIPSRCDTRKSSRAWWHNNVASDIFTLLSLLLTLLAVLINNRLAAIKRLQIGHKTII